MMKIDPYLKKRINPTNLTPLIVIGVLFFIVHLTGDHVFNKTNTLKLVLLTFSCLMLLVYTSIYRAANQVKTTEVKILFLFLAPILATIPGFILTDGQYGYSAAHELSVQLVCVIWAFLLYWLLMNREDIGRILNFIIPTIFFVCIIALIEKAGFHPLITLNLNPFEAEWVSKQIIYQGSIERVESTFGNINYFASFIIQVIPLILFLLLNNWNNKDTKNFRWLAIFTFTLITLISLLLSLYFTGTRAAIFSFLITITLFTILYFSFIKPIAFRYKLIALGVVLGPAFTAILIDSDLYTRFQHLETLNAWQSRTVAWNSALASIKEAPFFGYGIGSSYQLFFDFVNSDSRLWTSERSYNHVHLDTLETIQEGGIFGLIIYLLFWGVIFAGCVKLIRDTQLNTETRILALAILSGLLAYHIHGLFSVAPRMVVSRMIAYTLVGIFFALFIKHSRKTAYSNAKVISSLPLKAMLFLTLFSVCAWLIPYAKSQYNYATSIAIFDDNQKLFKLAENSDDIYTLNEAIKRAAQVKDSKLLNSLANKISDVFPNYRNNLFYQAYGYHLTGMSKKSLKTARLAQSIDEYSPETNLLLTQISYNKNDIETFKLQLEIALKIFGCANKVFNCDRAKIRILLKEITKPIQFQLKSNVFTIYLDHSFFIFLRNTFNQNKFISTSQYQNDVIKIINLISTDNFFKPQSILSTQKISPATINNVTRYLHLQNLIKQKNTAFQKKYLGNYSEQISIWEQRKLYEQLAKAHEIEIAALQNQTSLLSDELKKEIDLNNFLRKRKVLIDIARWFALSLNDIYP